MVKLLTYPGGEYMLIVLIFIGIICIILLMLFAIVFSTLRIEVANLHVNIGTAKDINNYKIHFRLYLFNKIRWFGMKMNNKKVKKFEKGRILKLIDKKIGMRIEEEIKDLSALLLKQREKIFSKNTWKYIKSLDIKLSKLKMNVALGTEDAIITSYLTAFISAAISIVLAFIIKDFKKEKYAYTITPLYKNQNLLKMDFNCIINIKMVHIINVIMQGYTLLSKKKYYEKRNVPLRRRRDNRHGASDRRTYGHSYEQY